LDELVGFGGKWVEVGLELYQVMDKLELYQGSWRGRKSIHSKGGIGMFESTSKWGCECQRYFIQTEKKNKKGNPVSIPIEVRKMHIRGNFIFTDWYRVTLVKRRGERLYCVKQRRKPQRPWWDKTPLKDEDYQWEREGTYTREQFLGWLTGRIANPLAAVVEMETCPPDNVTKLAA